MKQAPRMSRERWAKLKELFSAAADDNGSAAPAWLLAECDGDLELLGQTERLLASHRRLMRTPESPAPVRALTGARFESVRFLGGGGFGDVYAAFDHKLGTDVAVKRLREPDGDALRRFKREFRLGRIQHRNLVRIHELIHEDANWLLVMELVEGWSFEERLARLARAEAMAKLPDLFSQLAEGLAALHAAGVIHGDVKPSNVRIAPDDRVVLLDFGLAARTGVREAASQSPLATPGYCSPDRVSGKAASVADDWYSAGVVLYQVLGGRLPVRGDTSPVLEDTPDVSGVLGELCAGLLRPNPVERFGAAEVFGRLRGRVPCTLLAPVPTAFAGRERELDILHHWFDEVRTGAGVCVSVTGESGIGKTELVEHFLTSLPDCDPGVVVLRGRCFEAESLPYEAFDELLDELARSLQELDRDLLDAILPRNIRSLARVFPVFRPFLYFQRARTTGPADPLEERAHAFRSLRELLARLSDRRQVVLFIDDIQWADAESKLVLEALLEGADAPPLMLILAYRAEDRDRAPLPLWVRDNAHALTIRSVEIVVPWLSTKETRELAMRALAFLPAGAEREAAVLQVIEHAGGSPFLVGQFASHLQTHSMVDGSITLGDVVRSKLASLDAKGRAVLELIAAAGEPISESIICKAAGVHVGWQALREGLLQLRLLRVSSRSEIDIYHSRLRSVVLEAAPPVRRREVHRLLGVAIEKAPGANPERVFEHYREGGELEKAAIWAGIAGDKAFAVLAFDRAAALYNEGLALLPRQTGNEWLDLQIRRARALASAGRGSESAEVYFRAAAEAGSQAQHLRIQGTEQLLRSGRLTAGLASLREVLRKARVPYPESRVALAASILLLRSRVRLRGLHLSAKRTSAGRIAQMDACWSGAVGSGLLDPLRSAEFSARHLLWALDSGDERRLCLALAGEATQSLPDGFRTSTPETLIERAQEISDRLGDSFAAAFVTSMSGIAACMRGEWRRCLVENDQALELYLASGSGGGWEQTTAVLFTLISRLLMGEWKDTSARLPSLFADAKRRGDTYSEVNLRLLPATYAIPLAADRPLRALEETRHALAVWNQPRFDMQKYYATMAEVEVELYRGDGVRAREIVEQAWPECEKAGLLRLPLTRVFGYYTRAKCAIAAAVGAAGEREALLRKAGRFRDVIARERRPYAEALTVLLDACIAATRGDRNAAIDALNAAQQQFADGELIPWAAACSYRRQQLSSGKLHPWFEKEAIVNPAGIADLLAPGGWDAASRK